MRIFEPLVLHPLLPALPRLLPPRPPRVLPPRVAGHRDHPGVQPRRHVQERLRERGDGGRVHRLVEEGRAYHAAQGLADRVQGEGLAQVVLAHRFGGEGAQRDGGYRRQEAQDRACQKGRNQKRDTM